MEESHSIPRKESQAESQGFEYLRQLGVESLQKLSGKIWTDYNVHDPGVTLLEILCYAVSEAGFRAQFSVPDLLEPPPKEAKPAHTLFGPAEMLYSAPITTLDYNRLFLDIDGVAIARLIPSRRNPDFKGIFDLEVQLSPGADSKAVRKKILDLYHGNRLELPSGKEEKRMLRSNRNLCEDLDEVYFLEETPVRFSISIQIAESAHISGLVRMIATALSDYLSPPIRFYQRRELQAEGMRMEEILNGAQPAHGFVPDFALEELQLRTEIRTSELYQTIAALEGIREVQHIGMRDRFNIFHPWVCKVEDGKVPALDAWGSEIEMFNGEGTRIFHGNLHHARAALTKVQQLRTAQKMEPFHLEPGEYVDMEAFGSLQNEFPRIYGIGVTGLPASADAKQRGRAKQLQGFLLFFEQSLGNFFAEIAQLKRSFSIESVDQNKYFQGLFDIPGVEWLYQPFLSRFIQRHMDMDKHKVLQMEWESFKSAFLAWKEYQASNGWPQSDRAALEKCWMDFRSKQGDQVYLDAVREMDDQLYAAVESRVHFLKGRNQILDHLLARFAVDALDLHINGSEDNAPLRHIQDKLNLLGSLPYASRARSVGMDLGPGEPTREEGEDETIRNISGLEAQLRERFRIGGNDHEDLDDAFFTGKKKKKQGERFLEIEVFDTQVDIAMVDVFRYGSRGEYIHPSGGKREFILKDGDGKTLAHLTLPKGVKAPIAKSDVASQLKEAGNRFENLYLVEHLSLRPLKASPSFGFVIQSPRTGNTLFESGSFKTWSDREEILWEVLREGRMPDRFQAKRMAHRQFKISFVGEGFELLGPEFMVTEEETNEKIKEYQADFRRLYEEIVSRGSEAEKLFRMKDPGTLRESGGAALRLVHLYEAGFDAANYSHHMEDGGLHLSIQDPRSKASFQSFQKIEAEDAEGMVELLSYFQNYCISYFKNHFLRNTYTSPHLQFRTTRHGLYEELQDPYSNIISIVLPDWPQRFQASLFRSALEKSVFSLAPAHLVTNVRWLKFTEMKRFEELYGDFLEARQIWKQGSLERELLLEQLKGGTKNVEERRRWEKRVGELTAGLSDWEVEISKMGDEILLLIG